jgi:lysophospholipase L1-like esterase
MTLRRVGATLFFFFIFLSLGNSFAHSARGDESALSSSLPAPLLITRTLDVGTEGNDVTALQLFLKEKGFFTYPTTTGYFGNLTKQAVVLFQKDNGLETVGKVGPLTRAMLKVDSLKKIVAWLTNTIQQFSATTPASVPSPSTPAPAAPTLANPPANQGTSNPPISGGVTVSPSTDTTAPVISSATSSVGVSTTTIAWVTDEASDSRINYGTSTSYGSVVTDPSSFTTSHALSLTGLTSYVTYHFQIQSADAHGNVVISADQTFTTQFQVAGLPKWSAAVRATLSGQRNARVIFIGDSTTAGYDASNSLLAGNNKVESVPTVVAGLFPNSLGGITSLSGSQNAPNTANYDHRVSFGFGWGFSSVSSTAGQILGAYALESTGPTDFTFTPGKAWDTAELYYQGYDAGGTANVSINSTGSIGIITTLSPGSSTASYTFNKATFTKTLGNDTFNTRRLTGTKYDFDAFVLYNSTVKEITVMNAGWSGAKAADVVAGTGPWSTLNGLATYAPDLVVVDLGINDWNQATATTEASFKASMQSIINAATGAGADVLMIVPLPSGTANGIAHEDAFQTYIHDLATLNNLPILDFISLWGSYATANANGWMSDTLHPNAVGYAQKAQSVYSAIWP